MCLLSKRICKMSSFNECEKYKRVIDIVERGKATRPHLKELSRKDRDYLKYAYNKAQNRMIEPEILKYMRKFVSKIATDDCRRDKACPYKALLPEYDVK